MIIALQAAYFCDAAARRHTEAIVSATRVAYAVPIYVRVKAGVRILMASNFFGNRIFSVQDGCQSTIGTTHVKFPM